MISNSLNREFYYELLHIIGLTETKHGNKKLIERLPANQRNGGSLLEGAIAQIEIYGNKKLMTKTGFFNFSIYLL